MFENFLTNENSWLNEKGPLSKIVFSSRLRLARNLADMPFPSRLSKPEAQSLVDKGGELKFLLGGSKDNLFLKISGLDKVDKEFLLERHLISRQFLTACPGGLVFSSDERISAMINEEDHFRIQVVETGYDLKKCWDKLNEIDDRLDRRFNYAFLPDLGYLTCCPTNLGTGLRASCMLHLPGLVLTDKIKKVFDLLDKISFTIRGLFGEGSQALGDFFQVSNQASLGISEKEIIDDLSGVVTQISQHELDARNQLLKDFRIKLEDIAWRALGAMENCRLISCREAFRQLSALSLGIDLGIIKRIKKETVNKLFIISQPAHIQKMAGGNLPEKKRDYLRAELLREKLRG